MNNLIKGWIYRDAKWWEFWMPQSGFTGGFVMGTIICQGAWLIF